VTARFTQLCGVFCVATFASLATSVRADESNQGAEPSTLVAVTVQDEPRKLPKDITAMLSRTDRRVRFELVKLAGNSDQSLAGMSVTVIDPNGQTKLIKSDASGIAMLDDAKPGLHAVVIGGAQGHGAIPFAIREMQEEDEAADAPKIAMSKKGPATLRLPLIDTEPNEVIKIARSSRRSGVASNFSDIDTDFVSTASVSDAFGYRIRLSQTGALSGQLLSLVRSGISTAGVEGTSVMVYRGNALAGEAVADQNGFFRIENLASGVYGLIAVGPSGYAAFGFDAYSAQTIAQSRLDENVTLVSTASMAPGDGDVLPVVLVPTPMVEPLIQSLEQSYGPLLDGGQGASLAAGLPGLALAGIAGAGAAGGSGGGAAGAGAGGLGALGLAAIAAPLAIVGADASNNNNPGPEASPVK